MTREEAIKILNEEKDFQNTLADKRVFNAICIAIKALEQTSTLDKIRADVINIADGRRSMSVRSVINIINKYKAESEE